MGKMNNELVDLAFSDKDYRINEIEGDDYTFIIGNGRIEYKGKEFKIKQDNISGNWIQNLRTHFNDSFYKELAESLKVDNVDNIENFWRQELKHIHDYLEGLYCPSEELIKEEIKELEDEGYEQNGQYIEKIEDIAIERLNESFNDYMNDKIQEVE